jgi:transposase InsO family protein
MCRIGEVSRAGYYRSWKTTKPREEETALRDQLQKIALSNRHYGYRRIGVMLRREGWQANNKRVLRLMRADNLLCLRKSAFVPPTTDSQHGWHVFPNLIRWIKTTAINQIWVADITYVRLNEEFVYLAVVIDAHSRRVVGWALEKHLGSILAIRALKMALQERKPAPGMIHHSDRGIQYACPEYVALLNDHGIQISMSRVGTPYDNAKAESFMKTLKHEEVNGQQYRDAHHVQHSIFEFIENVYNGQRLHSALGYLSPVEFEKIEGKKGGFYRVSVGEGIKPLPPHPYPRIKQSVPIFSVSS